MALGSAASCISSYICKTRSKDAKGLFEDRLKWVPVGNTRTES